MHWGPILGIAGMMGGASAMHGVIQGVAGLDAISKNSSMHGQMQGVMNAASKAEATSPGITQAVRGITNQLAAAERAQIAVMNDDRFLRFAQDFSAIPDSWNEALNARRYGMHVDIPRESISGKGYLEFEQRANELSRRANERYNAAAKEHGLEGVDPEPGPLHSGSVSSWGTSGAVKSLFNETVTGVQNFGREAGGGAAKGFNSWNKEALGEDWTNALLHIARFDGEKFSIPKKDGGRYLESGFEYLGEEPGGKKMSRSEGNDIIPLDRNGNPIKTEEGYRAWVDEEVERVKSDMDQFKNVSDDPGINQSPKYDRKFPFLPRAHKSTFTDLMNDITGMEMSAAALESHSPNLAKQIEGVRTIYGNDKVSEYLGGSRNSPATTLLGRAYQQRGQLNSGKTWRFTRALNAFSPLAYRQALSVNPTPVAAQQAQTVAQSFAFMPGDKKFPLRFGKEYMGQLGKHLKNTITREPGDLNIPSNRNRRDPLTLEGMPNSTAMINAAIDADAGQQLGNVVRNGNSEWLGMMFSDEDLAHLKRSILPDGSADMSDPRVRRLSSSVSARYAEGINGLDMATSKPSIFAAMPNSKLFVTFLSTPMIVTKTVGDLYRPGGMFHTGNKAADLRARAAVTAALAGQYIGANAVRGSAILKAVSLLSAGALLPAAAQLQGVATGYKSNAEQQNKAQQTLLKAAVQRLVTGKDSPERFVNDLVALTGTGITGSLPVKMVGPGDFVGSLAGSVDKRLGYRDGAGMQSGGLWQGVRDAAALAAPVSVPLGIAEKMAKHFDPNVRNLNGDAYSLFMRGGPLPYFSGSSFLLPKGAVEKKMIREPERVKSGGSKEKIISKTR